MPTPDWRLAVDIGGTFTDVVLLDAASGRVVVDKTLTTPAAPLDGVRAGVTQLLAKARVAPSEIAAPIVHATTLITNALIEGKTGRAGLVTTKGFGDTLLIRGTGRTDFQNGDPYDQYHSLFDRLLKLPEATFVFPAHDYKGDTVSTIGEEKAFNPRLQVSSAEEYAEKKQTLLDRM